ncbi:MAG: hypothetical protein ACK5PS_17530 [Desulfopila sp.]
MKKVLVATAGLMMIGGTMASSAMAEFYFDGDARTRFYYQENYENEVGTDNQNKTDDNTNWKSRVRFNVRAETKGGAYAHTRIRLGDGRWGEDNPRDGGTKDVYVDRAYIGVPFGLVTVEAGRQARDITNWLSWDVNTDGIDFNYKTDETIVVAYYDLKKESDNDQYANDNDEYGLIVRQDLADGWALTVAGAYVNNQAGSTQYENGSDGGIATVKVDGAIQGLAMTAEIGYQEDGTGYDSQYSTDDSGFGGYLTLTVPVGPASIAGTAGATFDGFAWDNGDWGPFEMIGDVNIINVGWNPSDIGETFFGILNPSYQATEDLTLSAVFAYVSMNEYNGDKYDLFETSGRATYAVADGAKLIGVLGYLSTAGYTDDNPVGAGLSLELSF